MRINYVRTVLIVILGFLAIGSCRKKTDNTPEPTASSGSQVTIDGKTYAASSQIIIPSNINTSNITNITATIDSVFPKTTTIPSGGGYVSFATTNTTLLGSNFPIYIYSFVQATIVVKDTIRSGFVLGSLLYPIDTGKYTFTSTAVLSSLASSFNPFSGPLKYAFSIYQDSTNFVDSAATGTVHITELDTTSRTISGTYSGTAIGAKGSVPATVTIINGQFTNISYQKF